MKEKAVIRAIKQYPSARSALLHLFSMDEDGHEILLTTSSAIHKVAAAEICRVFEQRLTVASSIELLKKVLKIPGRTAWGSAAASDVEAAARHACLQHDIKTARGVLMMITLSPDCAVVASIKTVMNTVHEETPLVAERAFVLAHDEGLRGRVRVDVLAVGLRAGLS